MSFLANSLSSSPTSLRSRKSSRKLRGKLPRDSLPRMLCFKEKCALVDRALAAKAAVPSIKDNEPVPEDERGRIRALRIQCRMAFTRTRPSRMLRKKRSPNPKHSALANSIAGCDAFLAHAALLALPNEILLEIFMFSRDAVDIDQQLKVVLSMRMVCRLWSDIVREYPHFWSTVTIALCSGRALRRFVSLSLERSRSLGLHVRLVRTSGHNNSMHVALGASTSRAVIRWLQDTQLPARISRLTIEAFTLDDFLAVYLLSHCGPELQTVEIRWWTPELRAAIMRLNNQLITMDVPSPLVHHHFQFGSVLRKLSVRMYTSAAVAFCARMEDASVLEELRITFVDKLNRAPN
ncbi:hypothetical protein CYLTODRAFT_481248, partial [Cylindrobasidium torrendii FP15055 ss-10]